MERWGAGVEGVPKPLRFPPGGMRGGIDHSRFQISNKQVKEPYNANLALKKFPKSLDQETFYMIIRKNLSEKNVRKK